MPHISLPEGVPGISGPMLKYPKTAVHLNALAQELLRGDSSLSPAEREMIATRVSSGNECYFCTQCHAAAARHLIDVDPHVVDQMIANCETASISDKMKALLAIADKVRQGGRSVTEDEVARAHSFGADDQAIHDTVLIAAAFCMYNRYVDGLATWAHEDLDAYDKLGKRLADTGY